MLAADDDVGEAEVLPVDRVHDGFLRPAVEHLDVEAQQDDAIGHDRLRGSHRASYRCLLRPARAVSIKAS